MTRGFTVVVAGKRYLEITGDVLGIPNEKRELYSLPNTHIYEEMIENGMKTGIIRRGNINFSKYGGKIIYL